VKEALLTEAEAIDPAKDLEAAKASLRSVQDRWEEAGKVPRRDMRRIDDRLRAVERAVKNAEQDEWRRTDPRTRARVEGASSQLHSAIAAYQEEYDRAVAGGDPKKIAEAQAALEARKEWLAVIERSARDPGCPLRTGPAPAGRFLHRPVRPQRRPGRCSRRAAGPESGHGIPLRPRRVRAARSPRAARPGPGRRRVRSARPARTVRGLVPPCRRAGGPAGHGSPALGGDPAHPRAGRRGVPRAAAAGALPPTRSAAHRRA